MEVIIKILENLPEIIRLSTNVVRALVELLWEVGTLYAVYHYVFKKK